MIVVCDSGPLIALAGIGQLELLNRLYSEVLAPLAVMFEVSSQGAGRAGASEISELPWLSVQSLSTSPDAQLAAELGAGEAAAITLASQLSIKEILLDERKARRIAKERYSLGVRGTASLLVEAKRAGHIGAVRPLLEAMRANRYYLGQVVVEHACQLAGE